MTDRERKIKVVLLVFLKINCKEELNDSKGNLNVKTNEMSMHNYISYIIWINQSINQSIQQ